MSDIFDVFLSHNSRDKPTVMRLAKALKDRGLRVWLDEWDLIPGRPWLEELEKAIETIPAAAILVGEHGLGAWQRPEISGCLREFVRRRLPVIPVLLPGAIGKPKLPVFLSEFTWVDLRPEITAEGLDRLVWGITGNKPGADDRLAPPKEQPLGLRSWPPPVLPEQPYPVLLPYTHPGLLGGRDREIVDLQMELLRFPILGLFAPSGVGKTSLLLAGLVPELRAKGKPVAVVRHPREPGVAGRLLGDLLEGGEPVADDNWRGFVDRLCEVERLAGKAPLLVLDQFEDVLREDAAEQARAVLGVLLAATVRRRPAPSGASRAALPLAPGMPPGVPRQGGRVARQCPGRRTEAEARGHRWPAARSRVAWPFPG